MKPSFQSLHHTFDIDLAQTYGIKEAILIHHFQHWIRINKKLKRNEKEGRTWTYQTKKEIQSHFPYLTEEQIKYSIRQLIKKNILLSKNFNRTPIDKTCWYAFVNEEEFCGTFSKKSYERENSPSTEQIPHRAVKIPRPIPDTKTICLRKEIYKEKMDVEKKRFGTHVTLTSKAYQQLIALHGKKIITEYIERVNDYIDSRGLKPYKDYAATIRNWLRKESNEKGGSTPASETKSFFKAFKTRFETHPNIVIGNNYVEFLLGASGSEYISMGDHGCKERILNRLRKWGKSTEGLD